MLCRHTFLPGSPTSSYRPVDTQVAAAGRSRLGEVRRRTGAAGGPLFLTPVPPTRVRTTASSRVAAAHRQTSPHTIFPVQGRRLAVKAHSAVAGVQAPPRLPRRPRRRRRGGQAGWRDWPGGACVPSRPGCAGSLLLAACPCVVAALRRPRGQVVTSALKQRRGCEAVVPGAQDAACVPRACQRQAHRRLCSL